MSGAQAMRCASLQSGARPGEVPYFQFLSLSPPSPAGIFTFESASQRVSESVGVMEVKVLRTSGARGLVAVPYRTVDATAKAGEDYELAAGKLEFQNDETM